MERVKWRTNFQPALAGAVLTFLCLFEYDQAWALDGETGFLGFGFLRLLGIFSAVVGIIGLILIQYVYKPRLPRGTYHWILLFFLFVLPTTATLTSTATVMEGTKAVEACASCHVMQPFVNDLSDPNSPTLAARHYKNNWISREQCYSCHVTYGAAGTIEGKRDGFRHWLLYITNTYHDPIKYTGSYSNSNCMYCHEGTTKWDRVKSHNALAEDLSSDRIACLRCHGPPHPLPQNRKLTAVK